MAVVNKIVDQKLIKRFEKKYTPEPNTGCWLWYASFNKSGYGIFGVGNKNKLAHRVSWEIYNGEIPYCNTNDRLNYICVLHHCDNRACVNPGHLFLGTNSDNQRDAMSKNRLKGIPRKRPFGIKRPVKKLDRYIDEIKIQFKEGSTKKELAKKYSVVTATIRKAILS